MKFIIFALQQFRSDYNRLPLIKRMRRTHNFVTLELPHIINLLIKEERQNDSTPFD